MWLTPLLKTDEVLWDETEVGSIDIDNLTVDD